MYKHWMTVHPEDKNPPEFAIKVVKYCSTALERQIGEATRILLRRNVLNSKAGYNRSGVARLTIREEDMSRDKTDHGLDAANRMEKEGKLEMAKKALKKMQEDMDKSKKRDRDDDTTPTTSSRQRKQKKMRKLKYKIEEEDWGKGMQELEALEEKERADGRFLDSNLREATICTKGLKQQRIKIWTWQLWE